MANGVVVINADRAEGAGKPSRPVLPLDCRVDQARAVERRVREAQACEQPASERGVASMVTRDIDPCTLAAVVHRLLPEPVMKVQPGCSGRRPGSTQAGDHARQVETGREVVSVPGLEDLHDEVVPVPGGGHAEVMILAMSDHVAATGPVGRTKTTAFAGTTKVTALVGATKAEPADAPGSLSHTHTHTHMDATVEGRDARAEAVVEERPSGSVPVGTTVSRFDMTQVESAHERQTVLTQFPQEGPVPAKDADTLRLTYHFRSWQGQPAAVVSFNLHEAGRRLRVEAPDRGVYTALLANRDALAGTVRIVDGEPHSRGRDGRRPEDGE